MLTRLACLLLSTVLLNQISYANVGIEFDAPVAQGGTIYSFPINESSLSFSCKFDVYEYRRDGQWGPALTLHYTNDEKEESIALQHSKTADGFLVFNTIYRVNRENILDEPVLTLKSDSNSLELSMTWQNGIMFFNMSDTEGQTSKYFLIAPEFKPTETILTASGIKGAFSCDNTDH